MNDVSFDAIYREEVYNIPSRVTVVLHKPWSSVGGYERQLLANILRAVRLTLESVAIIQQTEFDLSNWAERPSKILGFISPPKGINLYDMVELKGMSVLFSEPLEALAKDEASKRRLWPSLKALFPA